MSGEQLKKKLSDMGYANISELSRKLGMKSAQNLHASLATQDVKTGILEDLASVLCIRVADFYEPAQEQAEDSTIEQRLLEIIREKDRQIERLLTILEKRYE